jgi:hypothetical protein
MLHVQAGLQVVLQLKLKKIKLRSQVVLEEQVMVEAVAVLKAA